MPQHGELLLQQRFRARGEILGSRAKTSLRRSLVAGDVYWKFPVAWAGTILQRSAYQDVRPRGRWKVQRAPGCSGLLRHSVP